jgi:parallel beta-helix repeat protein
VQGGWLLAASSLPGANTSSSIQFNAGDLPVFTSTSGLYVAVYQQNGWQDAVLPISSIDYTHDTILLAGSSAMPIDQGSRYYVFNAASQLSAANEWYYDPVSNQISLVAPAGFTGANVDVGSLSRIINVVNTSNITIAGLTITDSQSSGSGITLSGSTGIDVAGNTILNTGNAVSVIGSSSNDTIEGNNIFNTNGNGVQISPGSNRISVVGNNIHDVGTLFDGSGISFSGSSNDTISYNQIRNTAKGGISGGSASAGSYNDSITYNDIGNANLDTSDGGAIYLSGMQQDLTGDIVDFNKIVGTTAAGTVSSSGVPSLSFLPSSSLVSYGIYLDDYASGIEAKGNLLYGNVGGITIHSCWNNTISGNILAGNSGVALRNLVSNWLGAGSQPAANNVFSDNVVSETQATATASANYGEVGSAQWSGNVYDPLNLGSRSFVVTTAGVSTAKSLAQWQAAGYDAGAVVGDPMFVNPATGDYTMAAGSVALAQGIENLPISQMGLLGFVGNNPYDLY